MLRTRSLLSLWSFGHLTLTTPPTGSMLKLSPAFGAGSPLTFSDTAASRRPR